MGQPEPPVPQQPELVVGAPHLGDWGEAPVLAPQSQGLLEARVGSNPPPTRFVPITPNHLELGTPGCQGEQCPSQLGLSLSPQTHPGLGMLAAAGEFRELGQAVPLPSWACPHHLKPTQGHCALTPFHTCCPPVSPSPLPGRSPPRGPTSGPPRSRPWSPRPPPSPAPPTHSAPRTCG